MRKLFVLSYLVLAAVEILGFGILLIKEMKPKMFKTIIVGAMVVFAGIVAGTPTANAQTCGYTPDELIRMSVNLTRDGDPNAAKTVVEYVFQNCDDYETIFDNFTAKYGD